jgi:hypothetical protein
VAATPAPAGPAQDRTFLLLVDDLSFSPLEHKSLVMAAERFVATLRPLDWVGLATSSGRQFVSPIRERGPVVAALRAITGSRYSPQSDAVIRFGNRGLRGEQIALIEAVQISRGDPLTLRDVIAREFGDGCDDVCSLSIQVLARQIASTLESMVLRQTSAWVATAEALRGVEGAKILVAVSAGFPSEISSSALRRFSTAVTKSGIALHVIGEVRSDVSAEDRTYLHSTGTGQDRRGKDNDSFVDGLRDAAASGGGAFHSA